VIAIASESLPAPSCDQAAAEAERQPATAASGRHPSTGSILGHPDTLGRGTSWWVGLGAKTDTRSSNTNVGIIGNGHVLC
jgi:hypothetical protein